MKRKNNKDDRSCFSAPQKSSQNDLIQVKPNPVEKKKILTTFVYVSDSEKEEEEEEKEKEHSLFKKMRLDKRDNSSCPRRFSSRRERNKRQERNIDDANNQHSHWKKHKPKPKRDQVYSSSTEVSTRAKKKRYQSKTRSLSRSSSSYSFSEHRRRSRFRSRSFSRTPPTFSSSYRSSQDLLESQHQSLEPIQSFRFSKLEKTCRKTKNKETKRKKKTESPLRSKTKTKTKTNDKQEVVASENQIPIDETNKKVEVEFKTNKEKLEEKLESKREKPRKKVEGEIKTNKEKSKEKLESKTQVVLEKCSPAVEFQREIKEKVEVWSTNYNKLMQRYFPSLAFSKMTSWLQFNDLSSLEETSVECLLGKEIRNTFLILFEGLATALQSLLELQKEVQTKKPKKTSNSSPLLVSLLDDSQLQKSRFETLSLLKKIAEIQTLDKEYFRDEMVLKCSLPFDFGPKDSMECDLLSCFLTFQEKQKWKSTRSTNPDGGSFLSVLFTALRPKLFIHWLYFCRKKIYCYQEVINFSEKQQKLKNPQFVFLTGSLIMNSEHKRWIKKEKEGQSASFKQDSKAPKQINSLSPVFWDQVKQTAKCYVDFFNASKQKDKKIFMLQQAHFSQWIKMLELSKKKLIESREQENESKKTPNLVLLASSKESKKKDQTKTDPNILNCEFGTNHQMPSVANVAPREKTQDPLTIYSDSQTKKASLFVHSKSLCVSLNRDGDSLPS